MTKNTRQYLTKGIYCKKCNECICKPSKRKYPENDYEYNMLCEVCSIKDPLHAAFHRLHVKMTDEERQAWNDWRHKLWYLSDRARDLCRHSALQDHIHNDTGDELVNQVCQIPIMMGDDV